MGSRLHWTVLVSLWAARLARDPTPPMRISSGLVRGELARDGSHARYLALPYATFIGRFQPPGPEPRWDGVFEAINENVKCHQRIGSSIVIGEEHCLTLNVFTPLDATPEAPVPVMVFIHGGGFYDGSGTPFLYGPEYLVNKGIVLVTINYRLNIQGFVCLGIKEAPGNAGMKDQVAALRWVQRNIRAFGGDPDNVTIFGESAGAASVSYHILSPMSKGLFHKAILQSGSSLAAWAYQFNPVYMASLLAKVMLYKSQDPYELYNFFMNKSDAELIVSRVPRKEGNVIISELLYVPCTERVIEGIEPFLTEIPYDILAKGNYNKVPMIIGTNSEEGFFFARLENDTTLPKIEFEKSIPKDLAFPTEREKKEAAERLKKLIMGDEEISKETLLKLSKLHGEPYFAYPALAETELVLQNNDKPVYNYVLSYSGRRNLPKIISGKPFKDAPGATHADDLFYLFNPLPVPTLFETKMINRMTTLWTNFAKIGDPTPVVTELLPQKWLPTNSSLPQAFVIDEEFSAAPLWGSETLRYWHELYTKYRRKH
uniref:Carboxylic ester hydrolase n=1 Tax=Streltzoviella insularis TaxID=1206366 RepID=A0A7D5YK75_9NEOP|nr:carboxylesterase 10 [Streltzoviella insularis]